MAEIVEVADAADISETVDKEQQESQETAAVVQEKTELPEKLKGKFAEEIYRLYEESEKKSSRLGNEVHEVRQLADELLKSQFTKKPEPEPVREIDVFENPQEYVRQAIESNPKVLAAEKYGMQVQREQSRQQLLQKHPDMAQVVQDGDFIEWIKASPIRMKLFNEADQNFDFYAGDELLSTYKQIKNVRNVSRET